MLSTSSPAAAAPPPAPASPVAAPRSTEPALALPRTPPRYEHPIRLVALDIDGTLLRSDKKLSLRVAEACQRAATEGVRVVLATARPPRSVRPIHRYLNLDTPMITYNGALIWDETRSRVYHHNPLPPRLTWQVVRAARKVNAETIISVEILDRWYTDHYDHGYSTPTYKRFDPDFIGPLESFLHRPATKLMLVAPPGEQHRMMAALAQRFAGRIAVTACDRQLIRVMQPTADKAAALQRVTADYGLRRANVMAIGDASNDEQMIRWAGLGVAMRNAWASIRKIADVVTTTNDADGVAVALDHFVLNAAAKRPATNLAASA